MAAAGDDPVEQLVAGIKRYIQIVDENLDAVVLTYRESRTLDAAGRAHIKELEIATAAPLRTAIEPGIPDGTFNDVDVDLMVFDIMLLAHGWALKHWHRVRRASGALRPAHRGSTAAAIVVDWWLDQHRWHRQRWLRPEFLEIFALSRPQPLPEEYLNET